MAASTSTKMGWKVISRIYDGSVKTLPTKKAFSYSITNLGTATFYLDTTFPVVENESIPDSGPNHMQCTENTKIDWMDAEGTKQVLFRAIVPSEWPDNPPIPNC